MLLKNSYLHILLVLLFTLALYPHGAFAQRKEWLKNVGMEANVHIGQVFKHSKKFLPKIEGVTTGMELGLVYRTYGKKAWEQNHHYPIPGLVVSYMHINNNSILGDAWGILPNITFNIVNKDNFKFHFRLGVGFAYLTKKFNDLHNPLNNVIGSHLNNMTSFRFGMGWRLSKMVQLQTSASFTHYSNGASQLPNLGINVVSGSVGLIVTPYPLAKEEYLHQSVPPRDRRFHALLNFTLAQNERAAPGGPKYPVYGASLEGQYYVGKQNRLSVGFQWEYHASLYRFYQWTQYLATNAERRMEASRWAVFIGDELLFGRVGLVGNVGFYLTRPYLQPKSYYFKLGIRYYFKNPQTTRFQPHLGIYLKAHNSVAEYAAIGFGVGI